MSGWLVIGSDRWAFRNARLGVSAGQDLADACLEGYLGETGARLLLPGPIDAPIGTHADLIGKCIEVSPEDSADIVPFVLAGVEGGLSGAPGALLKIVSVDGELATITYDGPFAWFVGDDEDVRLDGSLRVVARIDLERRDR